MSKIAVLQMQTGIDPQANLATLCEAIGKTAKSGAGMLFTPEMSGLLDQDRDRAESHIHFEQDDPVLTGLQEAAKDHRIWLAIGSLAIRGKGERWANRAFVIDDKGRITARYDKMHMFDAGFDDGENWQESKAYEPGRKIVTAVSPVGRLGLTICYDLRFPALYDALGRERCDVLSIPAAFTAHTGPAHWHLLQRARAVESSAYVVAAAQVGKHEDGRETYGHSLVVDPWGKVVLDLGGERSGLGFAEIDPATIASVRRQLPSLANRLDINE